VEVEKIPEVPALHYDEFMANRYYTFMMVPEKGEKVRKITIPAWTMRIVSTGAAILILIGLFVFFDYIHVMSQVAENKKLKVENHLIRREIVNVQNRVEALDKSVARLKSFAQKLRVISELDRPGLPSILEKDNPPKQGDDLYEEESPIQDSETKDSESSENSTPPPARGTRKRFALQNDQELGIIEDLSQRLANDDMVIVMNELYDASSELEDVAIKEERNYAFLLEYFQDQVVRLRFTPSIIPAIGRFSSPFGIRVNPFAGSRTFHNGIDIANLWGTPVYATADGTVTVAGVAGALGQTVRIEHGYNVVTKFGHLSKLFVKVGQKVKRGDKIAAMGSTGRSTGPHLHYQVEVKKRPVNPRLFFLEESF